MRELDVLAVTVSRGQLLYHFEDDCYTYHDTHALNDVDHLRTCKMCAKSRWRSTGSVSHRSVGREWAHRARNLSVWTTHGKGIPSYGSQNSLGTHARWEKDGSPAEIVGRAERLPHVRYSSSKMRDGRTDGRMGKVVGARSFRNLWASGWVVALLPIVV